MPNVAPDSSLAERLVALEKAGGATGITPRDLIALVPRAAWTEWAHLLIFHGRRVCKAPTPRCGECALADLCPSARV